MWPIIRTPRVPARPGRGEQRHRAHFFRAGRLDAALVATERGRDLLEAVVAENPQVPEIRRNLADGHNTIGVVHLLSGRPERAAPAFERARAIRVRLAADQPDALQYQLDLAESLSDIGSLRARSQRLPEALELYRGRGPS